MSKRGLVAVVVVGAVIAAGVGYHYRPKAGPPRGKPVVAVGRIEQTKIGGQGAWIAVPPIPAKALVLYVHSFTTDRSAITYHQRKAFTEALLGRGFVVLSSDAHGDAWGDPASQADYVSLAAAGTARFGALPTFIVSESMGGVAGLDLVANHAIPRLRGWVGIVPVVDLLAADRKAGFRASIAKAYKGDPPAAASPANLPAADLASTPLRFYLSQGDAVVPPAQHAEPLIARLPQSVVTRVTCTGPHADPTCFQGADVAQWMTAHL